MRKLQLLITQLPARVQWIPHNMLAHPVGELLYQVGAESWSNWLHDATLPDHVRGEGRG